MTLLIVRHAPAGGAAAKRRWVGKDGQRPLSARGAAKMRKNAEGLAAVAPRPELIATSPLTRAAQTARIVAKRLPAPIVETAALEPEAGPAKTLSWLAGRRERRIALVGHEPHLGRLVAYLCAGKASPVTELKKGQACLVELRERRPGGGRLLWSLTPSQLRRLGS